MVSPTRTVDRIREKLSAALQPTRLEISDESHRHAGHAGARPGGYDPFTRVAFGPDDMSAALTAQGTSLSSAMPNNRAQFFGRTSSAVPCGSLRSVGTN